MVVREYAVFEQSLELASEWDLASDQVKFVRCNFTLDEAWADLTIVIAQFKQGSKVIECVLDEESGCDMPHELKAGPVFISVYGLDGEGVKATTIAVMDTINQSGYSSNGSASEELTPDLFEQLIRKINRIIVDNGGTGGGGIGFVRWEYDEAGYLHAYDEFGIDVLDPVYIPTLGDIDLSQEDLILAKTYLTQMEEHLKTVQEIESRVMQYAESVGSSAQTAIDSASVAVQAKDFAQSAANEAREANVTLQGFVNSAKEIADKMELLAKATQGYANDAKESAKRSEEAAAKSTANIEEAVTAINKAKEEAVDEIKDLGAETVQASKDAKIAAAESKESARLAAESETKAAASEYNAALSAEQAKQVAEKNGYVHFEIVNGRLIETRTDNVSEDMNFALEEGRLILTYGTD